MNLRVALVSLLLTFATASISSYPSQVSAQTVRTVSPEQAQGREAEPVTIPLAPGAGINISFIGMNAAIEKAWLDNPTWLTLDSDGCLSSKNSSANAPGSQGNAARAYNRGEVTCETPSYVLHLRRINDLKFEGLPSTPETTLSVITRTEDGTRQISVFRLVRGRSTFHTLEVTSPQSERQPSLSFDLALIQKGREAAIAQNLLRSGDPLD